MINESNLNKLYNKFLETNELSSKDLKEYGFNYNDINILLQNKDIEKIKRGVYTIKSINELYNFGKSFLDKKDYDKASLCFEKCFKLEPNNLNVCLQLFFINLKKENYQRVFELYDMLLNYEKQNTNLNVNLDYYLYLLNYITDIPKKHQEYIKYLKLSDIEIIDYDNQFLKIKEKIRNAFIHNKYLESKNFIEEYITKNKKMKIKDAIEVTLLLQAITLEEQYKKNLLNLINENRYEEVSKCLLNRQCKHKLDKNEEYVLKLANQFRQIKSTSTIPKKITLNSDSKYQENVFGAIEKNDYNLALKLSQEYNYKNGIKNESNAITLILNNICDYINTNLRIKNVYKTKEQEERELYLIKSKQLFLISEHLEKNDFASAFYNIRNYLETIKKTEYEFFIVDLIKINMLERKNSVENPMTELVLIGNKNYNFNISEYIKKFYVNLAKGNIEVCQIYFDIISKANELGQDCVLIDGLSEVLASAERKFNLRPKSTILSSIEKNYKESTQNTFTPNTHHKKAVAPEEINKEKEFIAKKYEELVKTKGIILLNAMDSEKNKRLIELSEKYPDMEAFTIGRKDEQQIVLRYKFVTSKFIELGDAAYAEGNYDECIANYVQALQIVKDSNSSIYIKLGLSYLKKKDISNAITYLKIATSLAKKEKKDISELSQLLNTLKSNVSKQKNNIIPIFNIKNNKLAFNDVNSNYGVENFDEINDYINKSKLDVESACKKLNMTNEQINIINLLYAREFYIKEDFKKGDMFIKAVEKSENKTKDINKIIASLKNNKKFYSHQTVENPKKLNLSLQPKRK